MKRFLNILFFMIEAVLASMYILLMYIGADYGLNSARWNTKSKEGFYPLFIDDWSCNFWICDQKGEVIGDGAWRIIIDSGELDITNLLAYSFYQDSLYVRIKSHDKIMVIRPVRNHGKGLACFFEPVRCPEDAYFYEISSNYGLFHRIIVLKRRFIIFFVFTCICHLPVFLTTLRKRLKHR